MFIDAALTPPLALAQLKRNRPDLEIVDDPNDREWLRMFPPSASLAKDDTPIAAAIRREEAFAKIVRCGAMVVSSAPGDVSVHAERVLFCGNSPLHRYRILGHPRDKRLPVGDELLPLLKDLDVQMVRLESSQVTDEGLKHLRNHPTIEDLRLNDGITRRGLDNLGKPPRLRFLGVGVSRGITHKDFDRLRARFPQAEISY